MNANAISTFLPSKNATNIFCFFESWNNKSHTQIRYEQIHTHTHTHFAQALLKPTTYQHFNLPSRCRGPLQTTTITSWELLDPPDTMRKPCVLGQGPPRDTPWTDSDTPARPRGTPQRAQGASQGPPQSSQAECAERLNHLYYGCWALTIRAKKTILNKFRTPNIIWQMNIAQ